MATQENQSAGPAANVISGEFYNGDETEPVHAPFEELELETRRGSTIVRYYHVAGAHQAVLFVGGVGGDFDSPVNGQLYPHLCDELSAQGIACLRVQFRYSTVLPEAIFDVQVGLKFLQQQNIENVFLVGHSFGGAVVIETAARENMVKGVATLSSQSFGADHVAELAPRCPLLLIHGRSDEVLPYSCSEQIYNMAQEPKQLVLLNNARHVLNEAGEEVTQTLRNWILERTAPKPGTTH